MIGEADTLGPRPTPPPKVDGYAKGALLEMEISCKATGLGYIYDDFDTVDDWINVYGRLGVSGGSTSDVVATGISYSAGLHKTQLLTDNCRAKVTMQDGVSIYGESRVVICSDPRMNNYYGLAIRRGLITNNISIVRGKSSISVDKYETTTVNINAGDEFEVWYDRMNSTVRAYQNGSEIASKYFPPSDIPHGPGCRWTGLVMGTNWLVDIGPNFDDFEASDVPEPEPVIRDAVDSLTPNPGWVEVLNGIEVNRHLIQPASLGPDNTLYTSAAVRWTDPMGTDSVKIVLTVYRFFFGKYTVVLRSNAAMTNWVGIQFDTDTSTIRAVTGTGPTTVTNRGTPATRTIVTTGQQFTITWDEATETIRCFRGAKRTPLVEWAAGANFAGTGRYVGMTWNTSLLTSGIEPTAFEAYDVTADAPLPGS